MLDFLTGHLPLSTQIAGRFIEPFLGGGAIYLHVSPRRAILSDLNAELIDLYRGIRINPAKVWRLYRAFPNDKRAYKRIRKLHTADLGLAERAARSLYLNRTCFKGMWRHNLKGEFNIGYGGQSRRWAIRRADLISISNRLRCASLRCSDFEPIIAESGRGDFLYLDPPYRPGAREQLHDHYGPKRFTLEDHERLARSLRAAHRRGSQWIMTLSDHPDLMRLYRGFRRTSVPRGTGRVIGVTRSDSGEVLLCNF